MLIILNACGSGSQGSASPAPQSEGLNPVLALSVHSATTTPNSGAMLIPQAVPVRLTYTLRADSPGLLGWHATRNILTNSSYTGYTSTALPISMSITVTPIGGSPTTSTGSCTAAASGASGACTVSFTALPGPTTLRGTLTESGNTIALFSTLSIIEPGQLNTLNFTANPVVSSVSLQLGSTSVNGGTPTSVPLAINAMDANNNIIAGTSSYVDANGNPLALLLNVTNNQAGGRGTVTIQGPMRITAPGQTAIYAHYDGNWLASSMISVTSTSSAVTTLNGTTLTTIPYATEYVIGTDPIGIVSGPDGNIWFTNHTLGTIGKVTTSGVYTSYPCSCTSPYDITVGSDGNLWYTDSLGTASKVVKMTTTGLVTPYTAGPGTISPVSIVSGPDGNLWYSSHNTALVVKTTTSGIQTEFSTGAWHPFGLNFGPDGNLWYLNIGLQSIVKMDLSGAIIATYPVAGLADFSDGVITGPDGNLWFVNYGASQVEKITMAGSITPYALQAGATPAGITVGVDSNLWFTEKGKNSIGTITTSGSLQEYGSAYGISANASPIGITLGADGNIWFTESASNKIAKFVF